MALHPWMSWLKQQPWEQMQNNPLAALAATQGCQAQAASPGKNFCCEAWRWTNLLEQPLFDGRQVHQLLNQAGMSEPPTQPSGPHSRSANGFADECPKFRRPRFLLPFPGALHRSAMNREGFKLVVEPTDAQVVRWLGRLSLAGRAFSRSIRCLPSASLGTVTLCFFTSLLSMHQAVVLLQFVLNWTRYGTSPWIKARARFGCPMANRTKMKDRAKPACPCRSMSKSGGRFQFHTPI